MGPGWVRMGEEVVLLTGVSDGLVSIPVNTKCVHSVILLGDSLQDGNCSPSSVAMIDEAVVSQDAATGPCYPDTLVFCRILM